MTTTPQEPAPGDEPQDAEELGPEELGRPGESPIPGEKRTPAADENDPEHEHESPRRVHGGEPT